MIVVCLVFMTSALVVSAQRDALSDPSIKTQADYTPVKILSKPRAAYPKSETGTVCMTGAVRLKITFLASGEIGSIVPVTRLPDGATENAIEAARKIKFIPAMRNGKPISSVRSIEYSFTIY
jgi:hypothetical protein